MSERSRSQGSRDERIERYTGAGGGRGHSWTGQDTYGYAGSLQEARARRRPKSYRRTDQRLQEELCERLVQADYIDASEVTVEVRDGRVTLTGTVPDRRMRFAIEDLAVDVLDVQDVDNRLRVERVREG